jgi:predicted DNA-binding ribbon-helix-helix protein
MSDVYKRVEVILSASFINQLQEIAKAKKTTVSNLIKLAIKDKYENKSLEEKVSAIEKLCNKGLNPENINETAKKMIRKTLH